MNIGLKTGGKDLLIYLKDINDKKYAVYYNSCDARGRRKQGKERAVEEWNRRANNDN